MARLLRQAPAPGTPEATLATGNIADATGSPSHSSGCPGSSQGFTVSLAAGKDTLIAAARPALHLTVNQVSDLSIPKSRCRYPVVGARPRCEQRNHRSALFDLLDVLELVPATADRTVVDAVAFLRANRRAEELAASSP